MSFTCIIIGSMILLISLLLGCVFLIRLCMNAGKIIPFRNDYKKAYAQLIDFQEDTTNGFPPTYLPVIRYYNEYRAESVTKVLWGSKIGDTQIGGQIRIDYTKNTVRVNDERFTSAKSLSLSNYLIPIIVCCCGGAIGFVVLVSGILFLKL